MKNNKIDCLVLLFLYIKHIMMVIYKKQITYGELWFNLNIFERYIVLDSWIKIKDKKKKQIVYCNPRYLI
jgi:hypothetical protein|tara:strand:- start:290 stop:499 length:210 start_codon:yes stop_codon:yes gene_type:complete